jgi:large subunit ribosomal protein L9
MEVILREPIEKLGERGDIVKVADGYARNYLLPRKLALPVTDQNRRTIERERKQSEARELEVRRNAEWLAARLGEVECVIARRVGENQVLYGSVTAADVAECLSEKQFDVDRRKIQLAEPIKETGEFDVPIRLHREVTATVKVRVVPQGD